MAVILDRAAGDAARQVLEHPIVTEILADMEQSAIDIAVHAPPTDHETRAAYLAEVRAIRAFRQRLLFTVSEAAFER